MAEATNRQQETAHPVRPFPDRIGEAVRGGGFWMDGYWVWGASVARGEGGQYHMFASRWPKAYPFFQGYTARSEIVRATAESPTGPFHFQEVVLGPREKRYWDGRMAHNPHLYHGPDGWYLFYCGVTYEEEATPAAMWELNRAPGRNGKMPPWMNEMRTGVAFAESLQGPWRRPDEPLDLAGAKKKDCERAVNAVAVETFEGECRIFFRLTGTGLVTAVAPHPTGPFPAESMHVYADHDAEAYTEDPVVFRVGDHYEMLSKDATGEFTGEPFALLHSVSTDGVRWTPGPQPRACSRTIGWSDGEVREQGNMERPFVLMEEGRPVCLYAATSDGVHGETHPAHYNADQTWSMVVTLR